MAKRDWERIRDAREDLTDYVIHFTGPRIWVDGVMVMQCRPLDTLLKILRDGCIFPSFASRPGRLNRTERPTVKGPDPAVCLTERTIEQVLQTLRMTGLRYSGYGIAFPKYSLHQAGGRPVFYGTKDELGRLLNDGESGFESGKEVYAGDISPDLQYLWVHYQPAAPWDSYPVDFTWEREWRVKPREPGLSVLLSTDVTRPAKGSIIVERDADAAPVLAVLDELAAAGLCNASSARRVAGDCSCSPRGW